MAGRMGKVVDANILDDLRIENQLFVHQKTILQGTNDIAHFQSFQIPYLSTPNINQNQSTSTRLRHGKYHHSNTAVNTLNLLCDPTRV